MKLAASIVVGALVGSATLASGQKFYPDDPLERACPSSGPRRIPRDAR